jgi:ribonuclease P protein component
MMGIAVPKRQFKKAVDRNRIKRLVREGYRRQKHSLMAHLTAQNNSIAFLVKFTGRRFPTQEETDRALFSIFKRLQEKA